MGRLDDKAQKQLEAQTAQLLCDAAETMSMLDEDYAAYPCNTRRVYIPRCGSCGAPMQDGECIECGGRYA